MVGFNINWYTLDKTQALRVHLCGDEVVIITIDTRTGRLNMRDTGDLAAAGRGPRFAAFSEKLNDNPTFLMDALSRLRLVVCPLHFLLSVVVKDIARLLLTWLSRKPIILVYKAPVDVTFFLKVS